MTNGEGMTKSECRKTPIALVRHLSIRASFVIRHSCFVILMTVCFEGLKFQHTDVFDIGCLPCTKQSHNNCETHGNFSRCDRDDEEDEHLCVIIGQAIWTNSES